jgi:uncharacterized protein YjbJ (UPF0337 family)
MTDERDKSLREEGVEDEIKGKTKEMKGRVKDAVGGLTGDPETQLEGKIDEATGKVQNAFGKAERKLDDRAKRDEL